MTLRELIRKAEQSANLDAWEIAAKQPTPKQAEIQKREQAAHRRALDEKTRAILREYKKQASEGRKKKGKNEKSGTQIAASTAPAIPPKPQDRESGQPAQTQPQPARRIYGALGLAALALAALIGAKR